MQNVAMEQTAQNCKNYNNPQNEVKVYFGCHQWLKILHYMAMDLITVDTDAGEIRNNVHVSAMM